MIEIRGAFALFSVYSATSTLALAPVLYGGTLATPHKIKLPFLCAALPKALGEQKALPFMAEVKGQVTCRAIALPKPVSTVSLKRGTILEKAESFLLLAHVKDDTWIMISERSALRVKNLIEDKVQNITGDAVLNTNQEALRKL